ncbi:MAG TPA: rod-binding protein [Alphaproteobacteria bacterium]|nr:rod-binding protein [Alphaproteobacteria bacterium]
MSEIAPAAAFAAQPSPLLAGSGARPPAKAASPEAARKAGVEFETMFLAQMMAPMFDTVGVDDTFGGGFAEEQFRSLLTNEYAQQIARGRGVGIADAVAREMLRMQEIQG